MKTEDRIIKLAASKMTSEATPKELQKLNDLFEKDLALYEALQFLFTKKTDDEQPDDNRSQLLFEKITATIKSNS